MSCTSLSLEVFSYKKRFAIQFFLLSIPYFKEKNKMAAMFT